MGLRLGWGEGGEGWGAFALCARVGGGGGEIFAPHLDAVQLVKMVSLKI